MIIERVGADRADIELRLLAGDDSSVHRLVGDLWWINDGQGCDLAGRGAAAVGDNGAIIAGVGELDIRERERAGRAARDVGEGARIRWRVLPLITERGRAIGRDGEGSIAADDDNRRL